jgi:hypothetical protein
MVKAERNPLAMATTAPSTTPMRKKGQSPRRVLFTSSAKSKVQAVDMVSEKEFKLSNAMIDVQYLLLLT